MAGLAASTDFRPEEESLRIYRREVERFDLLTAERERELLRAVHEGRPGAFEELIQANLRLVIFVAKRYRNMGVPFADLVNEGNIGLIEAARRFDPDRGNSFASYAFYWIRQAIRKALMDQRSTIRIPVYRQNRLRQARKRRKEEGVPDRAIVDSEEDFPESRFRMVPLNADPAEGNGSSPRFLSDCLADERVGDPLEAVAEESMKEDVRRAVSVLSERQSQVIRLYYGLGGPPHTLAEIGRRFGVTKEYIRQIRNAALERLRKHEFARVLGTYLD